MIRRLAVLIAALGAAACASAPPAAPPPLPKTPAPTFEQKMASILRLEDQRVLRDPAPAAEPEPVAPPVTAPAGKAPAVVAPKPLPPPPPDLLRLLADDEARIRRRTALAVGRVGLPEGVAPLVTLLGDPDPEVRQMAAFALGLIADGRARDPLVAALRDPSPLVQGSAAEALGLVGDPAAAEAVGQMAGAIVQAGGLADTPGDDAEARRDTPQAAFRQAMTALVRLKAYPPLAAAVLDGSGLPRVTWWPVAFALGRLEDPRALPALRQLARDPKPYTKAFAIKGLGALKDRAAVPVILPLVSGADRAVAVEAIRALGQIGDPSAAPPILKLVQTPSADPARRLEAVAAIGGLKADDAFDTLLDVLGDPSPAVRAATLKSLARLDPEGFVTILAGLDPDPHWSVRAALASVLGTLTPDAGLPRLRAVVADTDERVVPAALESLVKLKAPEAARVLLERIKATEPVVRTAAAEGLGELKPPGGAAALAAAYEAGRRDQTYTARAAALTALATYGAAEATPVLTTALADTDWVVRRRAAALLKQFDPASDANLRIRPAPAHPDGFYAARALVDPEFSTEIDIDLDRGTIKIELSVLDAPLTAQNFIELAKKKFFDGLTFHRVVPDFVIQGGDPGGDGEGGPGYSIRDEINERPYLRGTVGMALDGADTGGSQFFITHSPQPHLDGRYTVFGRVISGMELVDEVQPWEVIRRVRVWDGEAPK